MWGPHAGRLLMNAGLGAPLQRLRQVGHAGRANPAYLIGVSNGDTSTIAIGLNIRSADIFLVLHFRARVNAISL